MKLKLYWTDALENKYMLGILYYEDSKYYFEINDEGLKDAINHGCFGIGELNLAYNKHSSDKLFQFFERRIPSKDNTDIEKILEELDIKEYNEMELLKKTKGILNTDRYYLEE